MGVQDFGVASWAVPQSQDQLDHLLGTKTGPMLNATGIRYNVGSPQRLRSQALSADTSQGQGQFERAMLGTLAQNANGNSYFDVGPGQIGPAKSNEYGAFSLKEAMQTPLLDASNIGSSQAATNLRGKRTGASLDVLSGSPQPSGQIAQSFGSAFQDPNSQKQVQQAEQGRQQTLDQILRADIGSQAPNISQQDVRQALSETNVDPNFLGNLQTNLSQKAQQHALAGAGGGNAGIGSGDFWKASGLLLGAPIVAGTLGAVLPALAPAALSGITGAALGLGNAALDIAQLRQINSLMNTGNGLLGTGSGPHGLPVQPDQQVDFSNDPFSGQQQAVQQAFPGSVQSSASDLMNGPKRRGYRPLGGAQ